MVTGTTQLDLSRVIDQERSKKLKSFSNKKLNILKKASELSTLCDTDVFMIGYGPQGDLFTWPEDRNQLDMLIERYKSVDIKERMKFSSNLADYQDPTKKKKVETIINQTQDDDNSKLLLPVSGDDYEGFIKTLTTKESLKEFKDLLKSKLQEVKKKKLELSKQKKHKIDGEYFGAVRESHNDPTHLLSGGTILRPVHQVSSSSSAATAAISTRDGRNSAISTCNCSSSGHYCQPQPLSLPEFVAQQSNPTGTIVIDDDDDDDEPEPASSFKLELKI